MSTTLDKEHINKLIAEGRIDEAKAALRYSSDPAARSWLARLETINTPQLTPLGSTPPAPPAFAPPSGTVPKAYYENPRDRGGCLTIWLAINFLAFPFVLFFGLSTLTQANSRYSGLLIGSIIIGIAYFVFALATWFWKQWGVYGLAATTVISNLFSIVNGIRPEQNIVQMFVQLGILYWLISPKWDEFD